MQGHLFKQRQHEKGIGLIIIIMVLAFLLVVGLAVVTTTGTGSRIAGNLRWQEEAFNAAEAGFDIAWGALDDMFSFGGGWTSFEGHYLQEPLGIDVPDINDPNSQAFYFRRLTDAALLYLFEQNSIDENTNGVLFYKQLYILTQEGSDDIRYTYTVFLIDDEVGMATSDPSDVLMVCIGTAGVGNTLTTARLEVLIAIEQ